MGASMDDFGVSFPGEDQASVEWWGRLKQEPWAADTVEREQVEEEWWGEEDVVADASCGRRKDAPQLQE